MSTSPANIFLAAMTTISELGASSTKPVLATQLMVLSGVALPGCSPHVGSVEPVFMIGRAVHVMTDVTPPSHVTSLSTTVRPAPGHVGSLVPETPAAACTAWYM